MPDLPVPIIRAKLYPPPMAADAIRRERLLSLAQTVARAPLILVSAPAGYGKSTLASQWLDSLEQKSAWLSLDAEDRDIRQFLSYVVAALRGPCPDCCPGITELLVLVLGRLGRWEAAKQYVHKMKKMNLTMSFD